MIGRKRSKSISPGGPRAPEGPWKKKKKYIYAKRKINKTFLKTYINYSN